AAAAAAGWWLASRPAREMASAPPPTAPPETAAASVAAPPPPESIATAPVARVQTETAPGAPLRRETATTAVTPAKPSLPSLETQRLESQFRALQVQGLTRRLRAAAVGATPAELAAGDAEAQQAEGLANVGRFGEALAHLQAGISEWNTAASAARGRPRERRAAPSTDPRREVEGVITNYAAALESRDLSRVRRVYPGMTVQQAQEWGAFFLKARNLRVRLQVAAFDQSGNRADATVDGSYDYEDINTGRRERQVVSLSATLERGLAGWRLVSIR
ncbi:MAG: hypothetical protein HYS40_01530, partial [Gemmatimonadetes bacterium]|nr:hypothetical protein [Gemmatimonadota bacterium]